MNLLEKLITYFNNTPKEEIQKRWEEASIQYDNYDSPTIEDFLEENKALLK